MWTMLSISGLCKVVEAAELLDSWGLGVVKDWLSRRVGAVARGCAGEGERGQLTVLKSTVLLVLLLMTTTRNRIQCWSSRGC